MESICTACCGSGRKWLIFRCGPCGGRGIVGQVDKPSNHGNDTGNSYGDDIIPDEFGQHVGCDYEDDDEDDD